VDRQAGRHTDRQTDRQRDRQTDRQADRQKERKKKKTQKRVPSLTGWIVLTAAASRGALGGRDRKAYSTWYSQVVSPYKYQPGPTLLSFRDRTRSGVLSVVWP